MVASGNPWAALGVSRSASPQDVQAAYLDAAKSFHPDRLPPELAEMREIADRVFAAITDAHKQLTDPDRRRKLERAESGQEEEDAKVQRVLGASTNFAKAEHFLKRGDNAEALKYVRLALEGDPERGEYLAMLGWLESMGSDRNVARDALGTLNKALKLEPDSDRALYYRGAILKRLGRDDDAMKDFRRAATLNPQNLEAVREIRLHGMRSAKEGGLLSKWFGKKS